MQHNMLKPLTHPVHNISKLETSQPRSSTSRPTQHRESKDRPEGYEFLHFREEGVLPDSEVPCCRL